MKTVDVAIGSLSTVLPLLSHACTVVGSRYRDGRAVRLIIEGDHIPDGHLHCIVTQERIEGGATITLRFEPSSMNDAPLAGH